MPAGKRASLQMPSSTQAWYPGNEACDGGITLPPTPDPNVRDSAGVCDAAEERQPPRANGGVAIDWPRVQKVSNPRGASALSRSATRRTYADIRDQPAKQLQSNISVRYFDSTFWFDISVHNCWRGSARISQIDK